jgi:hypothetical protein
MGFPYRCGFLERGTDIKEANVEGYYQRIRHFETFILLWAGSKSRNRFDYAAFK